MLEYVILGIVQGVAEWLPVSSEGMIVLTMSMFGISGGLDEAIKLALFLHLGTFLAALVYFWRDVWEVLRVIFRFHETSSETRKIFRFLLIATLVSGALGFGFLQLIEGAGDVVKTGGSLVMGGVGALLLITGGLQMRSEKNGGEKRNASDLGLFDTILLGISQGLAVLPGLSRSGTTVAAFLLRRYDKTLALKLSFLMSLPIVLAGNILLNYQDLVSLSAEKMVALFFAFIFGLLTIHGLLKLAERVRFGPLVIFFGVLAILAAFL